jgi:hypothetical protein
MRLLLVALMLVAGCAGAHPRDIEANTLRLDFEGGGICSGTAVARDIVLTADHCLASGRLLKINGAEAYALKIVRDGKDHALVRVTTKFKTWARMGPYPQTGDRVRWIGTPAGENAVYREGYIARSLPDELYISAIGFGGDSGSGIHDDRGRLVAVLSAVKSWRTLSGMRMDLIVAWPLAFSDEDWKSIR